VLAWHRQVQEDALAALREAPEKWFNGKDRNPVWPNDLDGHAAKHRQKDIEQALAAAKPEKR
jgi:4'-phosphopantetheinyl transferase EntD